jgi:ribose 5-phosphate isomerase A
MTVEALKRAAAVRAVEEIRSGMVVGLGTGSTAELAVEALGLRVESGLAVVGVPTSERTRALAEKFRIPLAPPNDWPRIDLTIDGADQVERGTLSLIKGLGGALLREKIVASASARMIVVVDESKIVERLGGATPLPVEIVPFGAPRTLDRLAALGLVPKLRPESPSSPMAATISPTARSPGSTMQVGSRRNFPRPSASLRRGSFWDWHRWS